MRKDLPEEEILNNRRKEAEGGGRRCLGGVRKAAWLSTGQRSQDQECGGIGQQRTHPKEKGSTQNPQTCQAKVGFDTTAKSFRFTSGFFFDPRQCPSMALSPVLSSLGQEKIQSYCCDFDMGQYCHMAVTENKLHFPFFFYGTGINSGALSMPYNC